MHTVSKRHQTVAKMHVFHNDIRIVDTQIKMTEIPEPTDAKRDQFISKGLRCILGDTKHCYLRMMLPAEAVECFHWHDRKSCCTGSGKQRIRIKNPDQRAAAFLKINMGSNGFAKISGTDHNDTGILIHTKNAANDLA